MNTALPPLLETKLADFRRRVWIVKLTEGLLAALFGIAISYLLVFTLDRFFETPQLLRGAILFTITGTLALGLPLKWHRWVWRQRRLEDAARLLRRTFPRLGDQLLGIVELAHREHAAAGRSERLVQAAMAQAVEAVKDRDFRQAVPHARYWQWSIAAAFALMLIAIVVETWSPAAANAFARWLMPWKNTERYTFARIHPVPSPLVVPYAEPFNLNLQLARETQQQPSTSKARIASQPAVQAPLKSDHYALAFPPQKTDAPLSLTVGDVKKTIQLEPRTRPELAEVAAHLRLPAYLQYKTEPRLEARSGSVSVVKGANASFEAKATRTLASATIDGQSQPVTGDKIVTPFEPVTADLQRQFDWQDTLGLTPREPLTLKVRAVEDEAPKILARRESQEEVVLDSEVVSFDVISTDDFGIKQIGLSWQGSKTEADGKTPIRGSKVSAAGEPEKREVNARATFCAVRDGVAPQTLEIRAWADDYLPGREPTRSASFLLHVLNKTDHALWLTEQFGKWLGAAKETYDKEQQLHATNQELRELSAAELDRPENRRRVAQQAAAEQGNSARLDNLTQSGRRLVDQATRNDEFDAKRLESWATMLKSLKDIAANRMPTVADLLKQSSSAANGKPTASNNADAKHTDSNGNSKQEPGESKTAAAGQPKPSAPSVSNGQQPQTASNNGPPQDPNAPQKPPAPSIADNEKGFSAPPEPKPADPNAAPKPPGSGKLRLPNTTLGAAPNQKKNDDNAEKPPESPAQEKLDDALTQQKDLLAEFAKVSDQLGEILASLEASTFVKRLKYASREQVKIANTINQKTLDAFGIDNKPHAAAPPVADTAKKQSEFVGLIQSDLDAYFQRKQDARFKTILEEMKKTEVVRALARDGDKVLTNLSGQAMSASEYWADTLDRWSEELVAASNCKSCSSCSGDSLPPEIVLKVMQALRDEMKLRDETREAENARPALEAEKYTATAKELSDKQTVISAHVESAAKDIRGLPNADKFPKELQLLKAVVDVMDEATDILNAADTGPKAIAAETEAIELLLQAKRQSPNGGGGGGSNPGGGRGPATSTAAALSELGPGDDATNSVNARNVGQATGRSGREFPAELKAGLETYFNLLENQSPR